MVGGLELLIDGETVVFRSLHVLLSMLGPCKLDTYISPIMWHRCTDQTDEESAYFFQLRGSVGPLYTSNG